MHSIPNLCGRWQVLPNRSIKVFETGLRVPLDGYIFIPAQADLNGDDKAKRGVISGFSAEARRRLRDALLELHIPDSFSYGITLTVPWKLKDFAPYMDEFRDCWHRFTVAFRRAYPRSAAIYRIELQQRGAPHVHAIVYLHRQDADRSAVPASLVEAGTADLLRLVLLHNNIGRLWCDSVLDLHRGSLKYFRLHGAKVENIPSTGAMFRYLCDHTSKSKQAQLGYTGKQWGIISRENLSARDSVELPPFDDERHKARFFRILRKITRYRVQAPRAPFGSVLRGGKRRTGDIYLLGDSVLRAWDVSRLCGSPLPATGSVG